MYHHVSNLLLSHQNSPNQSPKNGATFSADCILLPSDAVVGFYVTFPQICNSRLQKGRTSTRTATSEGERRKSPQSEIGNISSKTILNHKFYSCTLVLLPIAVLQIFYDSVFRGWGCSTNTKQKYVSILDLAMVGALFFISDSADVWRSDFPVRRDGRHGATGDGSFVCVFFNWFELTRDIPLPWVWNGKRTDRLLCSKRNKKRKINQTNI